MKHLIQFTQQDLSSIVVKREGEEKLGEEINLIKGTLDETEGEFVLIGIPEDIGPRANLGNGGARYAWDAFLSKFLNMQSNTYHTGINTILAGKIDLKGIETESEDIEVLRKNVSYLDKRVKSVIQEIRKAGKTPIVIGGGHNNCFPIIDSFPYPIDVVNIDPHADLRQAEGRHSGNGFTFARKAKKLNRYYVIGLHSAYNSQSIMVKFLSNEELEYCDFTVGLEREHNEKTIIKEVKSHIYSKKIGVEVDLDSIKNMPSSAKSPIGYTEEEVRKFLIHLKKNYQFYYLHICEGAPTNKEEFNKVGKTIAYIVNDYINYDSGYID